MVSRNRREEDISAKYLTRLAKKGGIQHHQEHFKLMEEKVAHNI